MKTDWLKKSITTTTATIATGLVALATSAVIHAADVPPSHVASPDVYKVIAENDEFRVIMATWKPGQRDEYHSHPANTAYRITDCKNRVFKPDGSIAREGEVKAGSVILQKPVKSHSFQNVSDKECQSLIVEKK